MAATHPDGSAFSTAKAKANLLISNGIPLVTAVVCSTRLILASATSQQKLLPASSGITS